MPRNDCCAPGCSNKTKDGIPLHYFPNPDTDTERFNKWVNIIGGDIVDLDSSTIYKTYRVCRQHFDNVFLYPRNRLCKLAVPFLPSVVAAASSAPLDQPSTSCDDTLIPSVTEKSTQTCIKFRVHSSDTYLKRKSNENRVKKLQLNLQRCLKAKQTYYKRYLLAKKLSRSKAIEILTKQMSPAAKTLFCMQIKGSKVEPRGRRFTINEKMLALSLYKPSPEAYHMLSQVCVLPSRRTLQNLLQRVDLEPEINVNIFEHIKKKVSKMLKRYKLCSVLFDEMSIAPNLHHDKAHETLPLENYHHKLLKRKMEILLSKMNEKFNEQTKMLTTEITKNVMEALDEKSKMLWEENNNLKTKVTNLEQKVKFLEKEKRRNNLVLLALKNEVKQKQS